MKKLFNQYRRPILFISIFVLFIAGILDIVFKGLFFQLLPSSVQSFLSGILG